MWLIPLFVCGIVSGYVLFRHHALPSGGKSSGHRKLSVIIPARNEEASLPHLLESLAAQTRKPDEIIVVNDGSIDRTAEIARRHGVRVIDNTSVPAGWTGKNWAVWTGYRESTGDLLAFVDADVRLEPEALSSLIEACERTGGAVSIVPYHEAVHANEKMAMITNFLGMFTFLSPFETKNPHQGLYGPFIIVSREHYEAVGGHAAIRGEVTDDLLLGATFKQAGIPVNNFVGGRTIRFRMYPHGLPSQLEGFAKSAALSIQKLHPATLALIVCWLAGLLVSQSVFLAPGGLTPWLAVGYLLYAVQMMHLSKYGGSFGIIVPLLHVLSVLTFVLMLLYSLYQVAVKREVVWKGRQIQVGRKGR
jgi:hypothetical protein